MTMDEINGYFDDDGNQLNPDLIPKPGLCLTCKKDTDPNEEKNCGNQPANNVVQHTASG